MTLGALRRLEEAEVVVHDALVSAEILALCRSDVRRIDAGKRAGRRGPSQEWINALLISEARAGRRVVRLKGGDPFLFGRGGEEALALTRAGIPWEVVPGVSSALAAPASAGIPLTHRGISSSVAVVPGHVAAAAEAVNWAALNAVQTLVVLMAGSRVAAISTALLEGGRSPSCPVAIVQRGTLADQKTSLSTLGTLARRGDREPLSTPALLVVGEVVRLAGELGGWREALDAWGSPDARSA